MKSSMGTGVWLKRPDLQSEFSGDSWFVRKTHKIKLGDYAAGTIHVRRRAWWWVLTVANPVVAQEVTQMVVAARA